MALNFDVDNFVLLPTRSGIDRLDLRPFMVDDGLSIDHSLEDGGWELTATVVDPVGNLRNHPIFGEPKTDVIPAIEVEFDGYWWRMRGMARNVDSTLTFTFIDKQLERMARKRKPVVTPRSKATRREFIVARVRATGIKNVYSPEEHVKKRILSPEEETLKEERQPDANSDATGGKDMGSFDSTAYGPPWEGIQGTGTTANGTNLHSSPHIYGIAVDPTVLKLNKHYYVWPNPFDHKGSFVAFDTGGAIKGNRIDFYDWRGRTSQNAWGHKNVRVSESPNFASTDSDASPLVAVSYQFKVGEMTDEGVRENWWEGILKLSDETRIRSFFDRNRFICMSETELSKSKAVATITATDKSVNSISWNFDNGDEEKSMTVELQCDRWAFPPGASVIVEGEGRFDGRYIVVSKEGSAFDPTATITIRRPLAEKPEPAHEVTSAGTADDQSETDPGSILTGAIPGSPIPGQAPHASTHETAGLPGYPAYDYMAPAGTEVVAPVDGKVFKLSGRDPSLGGSPGGPLGYSIYIDGDNGKKYFLTHLDEVSVKLNQTVSQGEQIAVVANGPASWSSPHCHMGVNG